MGLLDGLEKLINEHGSAAILKERIALANDKYAALETKLSESESRVKQLESEKQNLELDNYKLKEKVSNLEHQLNDKQDNRLEEIREKILTALSSGHELTATQIAAAMRVSEQLVTFHLEELGKMRLVSATRFYTGRPTIWKLAQDGRGYLINRGSLT
jgi:DNA-binding transcriptional ArsR family regulator